MRKIILDICEKLHNKNMEQSNGFKNNIVQKIVDISCY